MIITHLNGGLGNQMFQYAAARRLAYIKQVPLKLDINSFKIDKLRTYQLCHFNIVEDFASPEEIAKLKPSSVPTGPFRKFMKQIQDRRFSRSWIVEPHFHFDPYLLNAPRNAYLQGYWQSEKYFKDIEAIIRNDFTCKIQLESINVQIAEQIQTVESVSIHIRRGDYISNPMTMQTHGVISLDYYNRAVGKLLETVSNPHFFIFSDDPIWAQDNIKWDYPTKFIGHNQGTKDIEDFRLLSLCKHHIIANSSFGWWGAWLCNNPDKIVFAPLNWFNDPQHNTDDIIPNSWNRI